MPPLYLTKGCGADPGYQRLENTAMTPHAVGGETCIARLHSPTLSPIFKNVKCVKETEILVEEQTPQGVFVCDHAGPVINKFSNVGRIQVTRWSKDSQMMDK